MALSELDDVADYRDPTWKPDSVWYFRKLKTGGDDDAINDLVVSFRPRVDAAAADLARRQGRQYAPEWETELKANAVKALIFHMTDHWEGSEFVLPANPAKYGEHAGQVAPVTFAYAAAHKTQVLERIERFLNDLYGEHGEEGFRDASLEDAARPAESEGIETSEVAA